jgi:ubiquinone/menaquinone biosynthesis C-methylase UbiE
VTIPWSTFLEEVRGRYPSLIACAFDWWQYNAPLLNHIRELVPAPAKILEVGTGTGAIAVLLAAHGYEVLGIDNDPEVLERARSLAEHFRVPCRFAEGDAFDLSAHRGRFDLAFSAGVIEHFAAPQASRMLREQGLAARHVLVVVPTWFALKNDPQTQGSDARPIRLPELRRLCEDAGLEVLKRFGYGTPDGRFSLIYRHLLPPVVQWVLQNRLSYACSVGCFARLGGRQDAAMGAE